MTRRHFVALADALAEVRPDCDPASWLRLRRAIGDVCRASNPRFDRARFDYRSEGGDAKA